MKKTSTFLKALCLALLVGLPGLPLIAAGGTVTWYDYEEGLALGKKNRQKILLNFYTDTCFYCKKLETETLVAPKVAEYLAANFVAIRVNASKSRELSKTYNVTGVPSTWFLTETGEKISNLPGYVKADMFINILKYIHSDSYKTVSFNKFIKKN